MLTIVFAAAIFSWAGQGLDGRLDDATRARATAAVLEAFGRSGWPAEVVEFRGRIESGEAKWYMERGAIVAYCGDRWLTLRDNMLIGGLFINIDDAPPTSVLSLEEYEAFAERYARNIGIPGDSFRFRHIGEDELKVRLSIHFMVGKMESTQMGWTELYRGDGSLRQFVFGRLYDYSRFKDADVVSRESAWNAALDAYARHRPYPIAGSVPGRLMIGPPMKGVSTINEFTAEHQELLRDFVAIPLYRFFVTDRSYVSDGRSGRAQIIDVDARTGLVMSIHEGSSFGAGSGEAVPPKVTAANLRVAGGGKAAGLTYSGLPSEEDPEGQLVLLFSQEELVLCRYDEAANLLWIPDPDGWAGYFVSPQSREALKVAAERARRPFGGS